MASPFTQDAGVGGQGGGVGGSGPFDGGPDADPTLGGPCTVSEQCDDGFECTFDACDLELLRCRFSPDDSQCQNGAHCDGLELCDNKAGCVLGEPVTCSDGNPCVINRCDEDTDSCTSEPRDVDGDGDPDDHCGGGDCDDLDVSISSLSPEVCANASDDDCDGTVDEPDCASPQNDDCLDPFALDQPGTYALSTVAAGLDYGASCSVADPTAARDVVAAVNVPAGPLVDVQLTARTPTVDVALALAALCDQPSSEIACSAGYPHPNGGRVAKVRARSVGDAVSPLVLPAYAYTELGSDLSLRYELLPASSKPSNETCGSATVLSPSTPTQASVVDAVADLAMGCEAAVGDLVYRFDLAASQDVDVYADSADGDGDPVLSLRSAACALPEDEITCAGASAAHIFRHALPPGVYYLAVSATAPTDVVVTLELSPPTAPPADEDCTSAPALPIGQTIDVILEGHQDDIDTGCLTGGVDAVYSLELSEPSDVLLLGRFSSGDTAAVELALPPCAAPEDEIGCATSTLSPVRGRHRNLPAGSYRVIAESRNGQPMQLTALVRPAAPPILVPFANNCADRLTAPAAGAFFQGTTANAQADFEAGCDQGGQPPGGAPDQILELTLTEPKRVVLDMQGSTYSTLLSVREGPSCPGSELPLSCAAGYYPERSFLDLDLQPSTYFILVDGYAGQSGPWFLDIHVVDP